jgi:heme-degrading monooxygenase HmoA
MPYISTASEDPILTVLNLFTTDVTDKQDMLLSEMRRIVDTAAFPGWISSTVHSGQEKPGTANFIQWRSGQDLEERYQGDEFRHRTIPMFGDMTTSMRLTRNQVAYTQRHPSLGGVTEISPDRDDYTVIEFHGVSEQDQDALVAAVGPARDWLLDVPGYRSHTVLRGLGARGYDGLFVLVYSQWASRDSYEAYRDQPEAQQPAARVVNQERTRALQTSYDYNTYRVVHSRSAPVPASA